jgi:SprB repeat/Secretion system C-terminal sorting domain
MKKIQFASLLLGSIALYIFCTSSSLGRASDDNVGNTGAPGETTLCSNCHNSGTYGNVTVSIQIFEEGSNTPVAFYLPNALYDMKVSVSGSSGSPLGYGFQLTTMRNGNTPYAAYSNWSSNVKQKLITSGTYNGRTYLEQNGVLNNNQFLFQWTAPAAGQGDVTFFASGVACNANNSSGGDKAGNASLAIPAAPLLNASANVLEAQCADELGAIQLNITSGVPPYLVEWSDGPTELLRENLSPGIYSVVITDELNQQWEETYELTAPSPLQMLVQTTPAFTFDGNGSIEITALGGTPPYTYALGEQEITAMYVLPAGTHEIFTTDNNGCISSQFVTIAQPAAYAVVATISAPLCYDSVDGAVTLDITGGIGPYDVSWSNGLTGSNTGGFAAGMHTATIQDTYGNSTSYTVNIIAPEPFYINAIYEAIDCAGDLTLVEITGSGGMEPYSGTGSFIAFAGETSYTISDANGCLSTLPITLEEPTPLFSPGITEFISCVGGNVEVEVQASGGMAPYTGTGAQTFTIPGNYLIPITDSNGCATNASVNIVAIDGPSIAATTMPILCNSICSGSIDLTITSSASAGTLLWQDGVEGLTRENLCAGTYSCTYTTEDGCAVVSQFDIEEPSPLEILTNAPDNLCPETNALVIAFINGGTAPYSYLWSNDVIDAATTLEAGTHSLNITDDHGCTSQTIIEIGSWTASTVSALYASSPTCNDGANGSIQVVMEEGQSTYAYAWLPAVSVGSTATNIGAGDYQVTITNTHGCAITTSISLTEPSEIQLTSNVEDNGTGVGILSIEATGGTPPYTYAWSNGSTSNIIEASTGFYDIVVTDSLGCQAEVNGLFIANSISENTADLLIVYPNPFADELIQKSNGDLKIYDAYGRLFYEGQEVKIDTSEWPSGLYLVRQGNDLQRGMIKQH